MCRFEEVATDVEQKRLPEGLVDANIANDLLESEVHVI